MTSCFTSFNLIVVNGSLEGPCSSAYSVNTQDFAGLICLLKRNVSYLRPEAFKAFPNSPWKKRDVGFSALLSGEGGLIRWRVSNLKGAGGSAGELLWGE